MAIDYAAVASAGQAAGNLIGTIGGLIQSGRMIEIEQDNLDWQREAFDENLGFMAEEQRYERGLQQRMFDREDSSVQRRVADLRAAGLSPVLAAGGGAQAGPVVSRTTPQRDVAQRGTAGIQASMGALAGFANIAQSVAQTALLVQQGELTKHQAREKSFDAMYTARTHDDRILMSAERLRSARYQADREQVEAEEWMRYRKFLQSRGIDSRQELEFEKEQFLNKIRSAEADLYGKVPGGSSAISQTLQLILGLMRMAK